MNTVTAVLLLSAVVGSNVADPVNYEDVIDYYRLITRAIDEDCLTSMLGCANCTHYGFCVYDTENSRWTADPTFVCPNGTFCSKGQCVPPEQSACASGGDSKFYCTTTGMFPNPGNCTKYHICVRDKDATPPKVRGFEENCSNGYGYNPRTTYCDKKLTNNQCTPPVPACKTSGDTNVLRENPSIYYVCLAHPENPGALYPYLFVCPNGKTYYAATRTCR